jgi:hypothetical protein
MDKYMEQLSPKEKVALEVVKKALGSSFNLEQSIGYLKFKQKNCTPAK